MRAVTAAAVRLQAGGATDFEFDQHLRERDRLPDDHVGSARDGVQTQPGRITLFAVQRKSCSARGGETLAPVGDQVYKGSPEKEGNP